MRRVGLVLAGLIAGALVASALPVGAHHGDFARGTRQAVRALVRLHNIQRQQIEILQNRVRSLEGRTSALDTQGRYVGFIHNAQVYSDYCVHGGDAVFTTDPTDSRFTLLNCTTGPYQKTLARVPDEPLSRVRGTGRGESGE